MKKILLLVGAFCNISTASGMDGPGEFNSSWGLPLEDQGVYNDMHEFDNMMPDNSEYRQFPEELFEHGSSDDMRVNDGYLGDGFLETSSSCFAFSPGPDSPTNFPDDHSDSSDIFGKRPTDISSSLMPFGQNEKTNFDMVDSLDVGLPHEKARLEPGLVVPNYAQPQIDARFGMAAPAHEIALPSGMLSRYGQLATVKQNWIDAKNVVDISKHTRRQEFIKSAQEALQQATSSGYQYADKVRALMEFDIACALLDRMKEEQLKSSSKVYTTVSKLLKNVGILAEAVPQVVITEEMIDDMGGDAKQQDPDKKKLKSIEELQIGFMRLMKRKKNVPSEAVNAFRNAIRLCPEIVSLIARELMSKNDVQPVMRAGGAKDSLESNVEEHKAAVAAYRSQQVDGVTAENKKFLVDLVEERHSAFDKKAPNFKVYHKVIGQVLENAQIMSVIGLIGHNLERMMGYITGYSDKSIHPLHATANCKSMINIINYLSYDARKDKTTLAIVDILLNTCNTLEHEPTDGKEMQTLHNILSHCITMAAQLVGSVDDAESKQDLEAYLTIARKKFFERVVAYRNKSVGLAETPNGNVYNYLVSKVQAQPVLMNIIEKIGIHIESIIANLAEYRAHSNINKKKAQGSFKEIVRRMLGIGRHGTAVKAAQEQEARQKELNDVIGLLTTIFSRVDETPDCDSDPKSFSKIKEGFEDLVKNFPDLIEQVKDVQRTDVLDDVTEEPKRKRGRVAASPFPKRPRVDMYTDQTLDQYNYNTDVCVSPDDNDMISTDQGSYDEDAFMGWHAPFSDIDKSYYGED